MTEKVQMTDASAAESAMLDGGEIPSDLRAAIEQSARVEKPVVEDDLAADETWPDRLPLPEGMKIPPGKVVHFLRFESESTEEPELGWVDPKDGVRYRWCVLWNINATDEKLALARTGGDVARGFSELAKAQLRVIDGDEGVGEFPDWTKGSHNNNVAKWWDQIGYSCRQLVQNHFVKMHNLTEAQRARFFSRGFTSRSAVAVSR